MQKRQQQAKQAPWSNKLSVLETHKLLKEHLRMVPPPPCHGPPGFHVGKKGKKKSAVSLQVQALVYLVPLRVSISCKASPAKLPHIKQPHLSGICQSSPSGFHYCFVASGMPTCQQLKGRQKHFFARQLSKHLQDAHRTAHGDCTCDVAHQCASLSNYGNFSPSLHHVSGMLLFMHISMHAQLAYALHP